METLADKERRLAMLKEMHEQILLGIALTEEGGVRRSMREIVIALAKCRGLVDTLRADLIEHGPFGEGDLPF